MTQLQKEVSSICAADVREFVRTARISRGSVAQIGDAQHSARKTLVLVQPTGHAWATPCAPLLAVTVVSAGPLRLLCDRCLDAFRGPALQLTSARFRMHVRVFFVELASIIQSTAQLVVRRQG